VHWKPRLNHHLWHVAARVANAASPDRIQLVVVLLLLLLLLSRCHLHVSHLGHLSHHKLLRLKLLLRLLHVLRHMSGRHGPRLLSGLQSE
jgi:hypothetical protein